ncbi:hypothetical protein [Aeromonas schubertii]|uniref:Uncharacterized protein n=1 Tax=Aeromonas schubertii TaxID=652 RepID=A0A0S2SIU6_9GAMM|nr:hypothetical protein [Aeromonas schubertii]ALP41631.1 hypothetical protein WL1483_2212 [Aeromonas schubertii]
MGIDEHDADRCPVDQLLQLLAGAFRLFQRRIFQSLHYLAYRDIAKQDQHLPTLEGRAAEFDIESLAIAFEPALVLFEAMEPAAVIEVGKKLGMFPKQGERVDAAVFFDITKQLRQVLAWPDVADDVRLIEPQAGVGEGIEQGVEQIVTLVELL